jgi:hypothetical protein
MEPSLFAFANLGAPSAAVKPGYAKTRRSNNLEAAFSQKGNGLVTGKSPTQCPAPFAKIFRFTFHPNHLYIPRHPGPHKGAFRDRHERWVRDAMDASDVKRRMTLRADGEAVWS